jgi:hypothetical protein
MVMSRALLAILVIAYYVLHQDVWFWHTAEPLVLGLFPVGLFYHLVYAIGAAGLMWLLVKYGWPSHLEDEVARTERAGAGERR